MIVYQNLFRFFDLEMFCVYSENIKPDFTELREANQSSKNGDYSDPCICGDTYTAETGISPKVEGISIKISSGFVHKSKLGSYVLTMMDIIKPEWNNTGILKKEVNMNKRKLK